MINAWVKEALKERGIEVLEKGFRIRFHGNKYQEVPDLPTALRQQQHIIDQQIEEEQENVAIGTLMKIFHESVVTLTKMTIEQMTEARYNTVMLSLTTILEQMKKKREDLRKDGYDRLCKVMKMLEKKNIPAANTASLAALDRMRKRWLVNEKVIDKSRARLESLKSLSVSQNELKLSPF